jgi:hypothetical protein
MSCKGGKASVISPRLRGSAYVVNPELRGSAYAANPELRGSAMKISQSLMGTAQLARCGDGTYYLRVTPSVVWISSDATDSATFEVVSDAEWTID